MLFQKLVVGLCFIIGIVLREVELTPIVTIQPENVSTTENIIKVFTTSSESSTTSVNNDSIISTTEDTGKKDITTNLGKSETSSTESPLSMTERSDSDKKNVDDTTTTVIQPVSRSDGTNKPTDVNAEEPTTPELITKIGSSTTPPAKNFTQLLVTSQSLSLKGTGTEKLDANNTVTPPSLNENQTDVTNPVRINENVNNGSSEADGDYRDRAPPQYHPYIEEILSADDENGSSTPSVPIRIKSQGYQSSQNVLHHPYGPLPKFAEKEMDKLRLNHWRVNQILKGAASHYDDPKLGRLGTGKGTLQGKHFNSLVPMAGQKRASSTSAAAAVVLPVKSSIDQDEFHTSVLASHADAAIENDETSSPSKLRTFFNWISNPLKRKPSEENERLKQAKEQQPILPFALGYRGDFLFW